MSGLRKVQSGQPLVIPAGTWNTFIDAARDYQQRRQNTGGQAQAQPQDRGIVLIRNDSGGDRERFDVLGISGPIFAPADAPDTFKQAVMLAGVTPTADHFGSFVVLLAPLAAGAIGPAMAAGVTVCKLNVIAEAHQFADAKAGQVVLESSRTGSAAILWKEAGTGIKWAIVKLGVEAHGSAASPKILGGSGATADVESWSIDSPPEGTTGVRFSPMRLYWSGTAGDPVYQFTRTATYDSLGRLVAVSAETRSEAFGTGPCEG